MLPRKASKGDFPSPPAAIHSSSTANSGVGGGGGKEGEPSLLPKHPPDYLMPTPVFMLQGVFPSVYCHPVPLHWLWAGRRGLFDSPSVPSTAPSVLSACLFLPAPPLLTFVLRPIQLQHQVVQFLLLHHGETLWAEAPLPRAKMGTEPSDRGSSIHRLPNVCAGSL